MIMAVRIYFYYTELIIFVNSLSVPNKTFLYNFNVQSLQPKVIEKKTLALPCLEVVLPVFIITG